MSSWKGLFLSPFFCLNRMLLSQITTYPSSSHPSRLSSVTIFSVRPTLSFSKIARWPLTGQASLVAQWQRVCLLMQEMQVRSLSWEDALEEDMATHSSILAWRIPWTEEPGGLQSTGSRRVGHDWAHTLHSGDQLVLLRLELPLF